MMKPRRWRIVPLRVDDGPLWWIVFFRGVRHSRAMTLPAAMDQVARCYQPH